MPSLLFLRKHSRALCCRLIVFARLAQFQPPTRTQLLSSSRATMHGRPICHCHKACQEIQYSIQNGAPTQTKCRKCYKSGSNSDIGNFDQATGWQNGPQLTTLPFFASEVIPDFPAGSSCPPRPIFTLSTEKALWMQYIDKRRDSIRREVPKT